MIIFYLSPLIICLLARQLVRECDIMDTARHRIQYSSTHIVHTYGNAMGIYYQGFEDVV